MDIAIIMDGNGRWASRRHLLRTAGHRAGAKAVDRIVEAAARRGIEILTLYAFSAANWHRPAGEVNALFRLLRQYLISQTERCRAQSIRLNIIGCRERLDPKLLRIIQRSEQLTAPCTGMHLRIAIDYSSQRSLRMAAQGLREATPADLENFEALLAAVDHAHRGAPAVDLLIRTGGEKRLSDFLLYECAYAELYFTNCLWPDFDDAAFAAALEEFAGRERRFGQVGADAIAGAHHG